MKTGLCNTRCARRSDGCTVITLSLRTEICRNNTGYGRRLSSGKLESFLTTSQITLSPLLGDPRRTAHLCKRSSYCRGRNLSREVIVKQLLALLPRTGSKCSSDDAQFERRALQDTQIWLGRCARSNKAPQRRTVASRRRPETNTCRARKTAVFSTGLNAAIC